MEPADPVPDMDIDMDLNMDMDTMQLDGPITVDPCLVSEYQEEIFAYKRMLEVKKKHRGTPHPLAPKVTSQSFFLHLFSFPAVNETNIWVILFIFLLRPLPPACACIVEAPSRPILHG